MSIFAFIALPAIGPIVAGHAIGYYAANRAQRTERAYRHVKDIVDQLGVTREREAQWAAERPAPPVWMNLAKDPLPRHLGRVCRFRVGDFVTVAHQVEPRRVKVVHCHEVKPAGWSHCMGDDALYELDDGQQRGDHELSFASIHEASVQLPHGTVRAVFHRSRLIGLTTHEGRPLDYGELTLDELKTILSFSNSSNV